MKIAYLHTLPLEYYPPATNTLDLLGKAVVRAYTSQNLKGKKAYQGRPGEIFRFKSPDPSSHQIVRLAVVLWWHVRTAWSLFWFRPDAVIYVEPHSALAAYLYFRFLFGKARLLIHHHEYYEPGDFLRPGMRLPRLGARLESSYLFGRAGWISQTNTDRLQLLKSRHPEIADGVWQLFPNYPPLEWLARARNYQCTESSLRGKRSNPGAMHRRGLRPRDDQPRSDASRVRLIYVGSASFHDTYIEEIVRWAAGHPDSVQLHVQGYNVDESVWNWLKAERFSNVTFDAAGYDYDDLPDILCDYDVGLVLYKGNTVNFVYNVPNKVFEYLVCGLKVWYPQEMIGIHRFNEENRHGLRELDFRNLTCLQPQTAKTKDLGGPCLTHYNTSESHKPLFAHLGLR